MARMAGLMVPGIDVKPIMDEPAGPDVRGARLLPRSPPPAPLRQAFAYDEDVLVPDVLVESPQVLVTEWVEGTPLARIITDGTQEQRDEAAVRSTSSSALRAPTRARLLHADPHPGNFRVIADGRPRGPRLRRGQPPAAVTCPRRWGASSRPRCPGTATSLVTVLRHAGFIRPGIDIDPQGLVEYLEPLVAPMLHEEFTPTRTRCAVRGAEIQDPRRPSSSSGSPQPAARVPAHPPGVARRHRRAQPDRRHRARRAR